MTRFFSNDRFGFITIFATEKSCFVTTHDIRRPCAPNMLAEQGKNITKSVHVPICTANKGACILGTTLN